MKARGAVFSDCGQYRYLLERVWDYGPTMGFIMLNPSTADAMEDDPTIRRCMSFAKKYGCGSLMVANLFAYKATDPSELSREFDIEGPARDFFLRRLGDMCSEIVLAWGANALATQGTVWKAIHAINPAPPKLHCLGYNKDGSPKHPLYLPTRTELERWDASTS